MRIFSPIGINRFIVIPVIIGFTACGKKNSPQAAGPSTVQSGPLPVEIYVAAPQPYSYSYTSTGTVVPDEETELKAELAGRIVQLNLPEGQTVAKGTLLVKLYDADLLAQKAKLQNQLNIEKRTLQRLEKLKNVQGVAEQEYDLADSRVKTLEAELQLLQTQLDRTEIRAPFEGTIGLRNVSLGTYLMPGMRVATLRKLQPLKVDFNIPEKFTPYIKAGGRIKCYFDGTDSACFGEILATDKVVDANTRNLKIRARLIKPPDYILPGASAKVQFEAGSSQSIIFVPTQAVVAQARSSAVFLCKNGKAVKTIIIPGIRRAGLLEVKSGIQEGDTVITSGILFLKPDMPVTIKSVLPNI